MLRTNLLSIRELAADPSNPFSEPQIRWWIFQQEQNGFKAVTVRLGRRIYIDLEALDRWLEDHRGDTRVKSLPKATTRQQQPAGGRHARH